MQNEKIKTPLENKPAADGGETKTKKSVNTTYENPTADDIKQLSKGPKDAYGKKAD